MKKERKTKKTGKKKEDKIPFHRRPDGMPIEKWQVALRRQFVQSNDFQITKTSEEIVYADYQVYNPATKNGYKVALRSPDHRGDNFCDCYDFKISRLGTCKHIEAVLLYIAKKRLKKHLKTPVERSYSSVYVDYRQGKNR